MRTLLDVLAGIGLVLALLFVDALLAIIESRPIEALRRFVMRGVCWYRGHPPNGVWAPGYPRFCHRVCPRCGEVVHVPWRDVRP